MAVRREPVVRLLTAAVLAPVVIAVVWQGGIAMAVMLAAAAAVMAREWDRLIGGASALAVAAAAALALLATVAGEAGLGLVAIAVAAAGLAATKRGPVAARAWAALGPVYVGGPCLALLWLRHHPEHGFALVLWLLLVVWAADIGAYLVGRLVGGPRLAPRLSPGKTWAGLGGGVVAAATVGGLAAAGLGRTQVGGPAGAGAVLALVGQAGDLFESWLKRRRGVKHSGALLPGHGGLLDRLDALLVAAPVTAAFVLAGGEGVALWP
jgi:phosphatidate cytidylyltransferase